MPIKKILSKMTDFMNRHYKLMLFLVLVAYFARSLGGGFIKGGRWDLYQNIAMADRFLAGQGFYYSTIEASSPYFPGVAFLSVVIGKFFAPYRDYILLTIASIIGTIFFYILLKLGERFSQNKTLSYIFTFLLISTGFSSYRSYMNEFKADSFVLLLGAFIIFIIDAIEQRKEKAGLKTAIYLFILGFLMDISKQQALYVDVALGCYLLFTKKLAVKEKFILLGSLIFAGILCLIIIFNIPGLDILAIKNLSDMPYWGIKSIIIQMGHCFLQNIVYFVLLFLFTYMYMCREIKLTTLENKWLVVSLFFGIGEMVGGWKIGGNAGNYETGMVMFVPFTIIAADYFYREFFVSNKKQTIIGVLNYAVLGCCIVLFAWSSRAYVNTIKKIHIDSEVSTYLSSNFGNNEILYYSNQYMQIARSSVKPGMDIYSVPSNVKEYRHTRGYALRNKTYKYLYLNIEDLKNWDSGTMTYFGDKIDLYEALQENYIEIKDMNMPESLKGQLFMAKE